VFVFGFNSTTYSQEKEYPNNPIQIFVTSRPGEGIDFFFRLLAEELKSSWKVPVNIINKPEGSGMVAASVVANANKDGYTILGTLTGNLASITVAKPKDGPVNLFRDFDPIAVYFGYNSALMVVRSDSKFKTLNDIINYAREKPGDLICASGQVGTPTYIDFELLKRLAKIDIAHMPTSGTAEQVTKLLGGHIHVIIATDRTAMPHIEAGKLRGIVADIKSAIFPDIPTFAESGYPEINVLQSMTILGPKGLPPAVIKTWERDLRVFPKDTKLAAQIKKGGYNVNLLMGTEELNKFFKEEVEKYSRFTSEELGWK
jgi:tripartite-type tricarboxylate transporter receptor subunit TctC